MLKNTIIVVLLWAVSRFYWDIDLMPYYSVFAKLSTEQSLIILSGGTFLALILVICSYILRSMSCFSLMIFFNRLFLELGKFVTCLIAIAAIAFWMQTRTNVWLDLGILSLVPIEITCAAFYGLWLYDFNYPIFSDLVGYAILPCLSILAVLSMMFLS